MLFEALIAGAAGGILWLDRFQALQITVSRPIIAGPLVGWMLGDPGTGAAVAVLYELMWLHRPAVGGYIPPDVTLPCIAATAAAIILRAQTGFSVYAAAFAAFLVTLPLCNIAAWVDGELRKALIAVEEAAEKDQAGLADGAMPRFILIGLTLGFLFAFVTLFPAVIITALVLKTLGPMVPESAVRSLGTAFWLVPAIALADFMTSHGDRGGWSFFVAGFILAMLVYNILP